MSAPVFYIETPTGVRCLWEPGRPPRFNENHTEVTWKRAGEIYSTSTPIIWEDAFIRECSRYQETQALPVRKVPMCETGEAYPTDNKGDCSDCATGETNGQQHFTAGPVTLVKANEFLEALRADEWQGILDAMEESIRKPLPEYLCHTLPVSALPSEVKL